MSNNTTSPLVSESRVARMAAQNSEPQLSFTTVLFGTLAIALVIDLTRRKGK